MINLKVFYMLCLVTPCIMALSVLEPEKVDEIVESDLHSFEELSLDEAGVKINWGPVWDDNHGNNEFVYRTAEGQGANCDAPNGLGLKNLIQQTDKLLPKEEIKKIVNSFAEDPEIKALIAFAEDPQVHQKLEIILNSKEYQILKDYTCRVLHLDLSTYHYLSKPLIKPSIKRADATAERKGVKGLINAIEAILPKQKLRELYEELIKTDEELVKAVEHLKSDEFRQLLLSVKNNVPEYKELRQQLIDLGVPMDEIRNVIAKALGWSQDFDILF